MQALRCLQTDYIDLYQIHRPQPDIAIDENARSTIPSARARCDISAAAPSRPGKAERCTAKELGLNRFVSEQPPYNLLDRRIERELIPMAQTYGLAVIPWSPLGGGLLTGKYKRGTEPPEGSRYADYENNPLLRRRMTERIYDVVEGLEPLAAEKGVPLSQFALAWCASSRDNEPDHRPRTMEQLEDNLAALEVTFTAEELRAINRVARRGDSVAPFYEADFGPHRFRV
jgi:aryl-alcohol dehydrogenase-like predicted oxidoreductase